ncbi:unnamed protein product [Lymnaea stagnalis]|uniref:tRNA (adenine(58)-N(1))-methyltransferase non-catalytic subunit TRM6 n=1 Tax=Lymnaea stagnalis TaxID=6523 RepID=A0AAV2IC37_LYMST
MSNSVVSEGDYVVFKRDGATRVFQMKKNRQVFFEKAKLSVDELIGQPFGSTFEFERGKIIKVESSRATELQIGGAEVTGADNRNLLDADSNQKMSLDDIMKMKEDGVRGEKIIEVLIENSETFKTKTQFSQAKYLKKKKQKHILRFKLLRPTTRLVVEIFSKEPNKICNMRPDTLSQLLSYSNVRWGSHVGVVETCQGLVLAALLERMGGQGKLIHFIPNTNDTMCRQVMDYFNFPKDHLSNFYYLPITALSNLQETEVKRQTQELGLDSLIPATTDEDFSDSNVKQECKPNQSLELPADEEVLEGEHQSLKELTDTKLVGDEKKNGADVEMLDSTVSQALNTKREMEAARDIKRQQRAERLKVASMIIKEKKLDSLVIACKYNPTPILMKLLDFVPPSRPVVVYCQFIEPLVECYSVIKEKQIGLQLKLSETWFREYQVLPQQTRPSINMSGTGGYLLTFMTTQPCPP